MTCAKIGNAERLLGGVVVGFEVLSPTSGRIDRIVKVREYAAVPSIRRYVILESARADLTVMARESPNEAWRTTVLTNEDILRMPEIGVEAPVAEIYHGLAFNEGAGVNA